MVPGRKCAQGGGIRVYRQLEAKTANSGSAGQEAATSREVAQTRRHGGQSESRRNSRATPSPDRPVLALDEALTAFSQVAPRQAKVVELRYFGGLTEQEIVAVLKISSRTVRRDWDLARAWLLRELKR